MCPFPRVLIFLSPLFFVPLNGELRIWVSPDRVIDEELLQESERRYHHSDINEKMERLGVYSQVVSGNASTDTVNLEFKWPDGSLITQLTDFKGQSQLMRIIIPGEIELGQAPFQTFCFVSSFTGDMIPTEAVMKLRQKNPTAIRIADEDKGEIVQDSPLLVSFSKSSLLSNYFSSFCNDARESSFSSEHEIFNILDQSKVKVDVKEVAEEALKDSEHMPRCFSAKDWRQPCLCTLKICLDWYPCALKYCKNKDSDGEHRCGIKTCKKCQTFRFPVPQKQICIWDIEA